MVIFNEKRNRNKLQIKTLTKYDKYHKIQKNSLMFLLINSITHTSVVLNRLWLIYVTFANLKKKNMGTM